MSFTNLSNFLCKMKGQRECPPRENAEDIFWSWFGAFAGIASIGLINFKLFKGNDLMMIIGSFGASAVLIYGSIRSPLAQPRNLVGGHVVSAFIGVAANKIILDVPWLAAAVAVATAIAAMHVTKTLHPPGGATALIAVIGGDKISKLGFLYPIMPVGSGALLMLFVALLVNNIPKSRRYPEFWW